MLTSAEQYLSVTSRTKLFLNLLRGNHLSIPCTTCVLVFDVGADLSATVLPRCSLPRIAPWQFSCTSFLGHDALSSGCFPSVFVEESGGGPASCGIVFLFQTGAREDTNENEGNVEELHYSYPACWKFRAVKGIVRWSAENKNKMFKIYIFLKMAHQHDWAFTLIYKLHLFLSHLSNICQEIQMSLTASQFLLVCVIICLLALELFQSSHWAASFTTPFHCCWTSGSVGPLDTTICFWWRYSWVETQSCHWW